MEFNKNDTKEHIYTIEPYSKFSKSNLWLPKGNMGESDKLRS